MKSIAFSAFAGHGSPLLATVYTGVGKSEVDIIDTNQSAPKNLVSNIKLDSGEQIKSVEWLNIPSQNGTPSKKNKRRLSGSANGNSPQKLSQKPELYVPYLVIGLETGEILVYSITKKEFVNKISIESSVSSVCIEENTGKLWAYDSTNLILKKFQAFDNRLQESHPFRNDKLIDFASTITQDGTQKLILASSQLYIINPENDFDFVKVSPTKLHNLQIKGIYQSQTNPNLVAIIREGHPHVSLLSLSTSSIVTNLKATSNVVKLSYAISSSGVESLIAITEEGTAEVFLDAFNAEVKRTARKTVESDYQIKSESHIINLRQKSDKLFVAITFNGSKSSYITFTVDLENNQDDITIVDKSQSKVNGNKEVEANGETNGDAMDIDSNLENDDNEDEVDGEENDDDDDEEEEEIFVEEVEELYELLVANKNNQERLIRILVQNQDKARRTIYLLSDEEAISLFKTFGLRILEKTQKTSLGYNEWLKWLMLVKGNLLIQDSDSVSVLKFVKSSLAESTKLVPNLLSLQGRLSLLQSQIQLRNQIFNAQNGLDEENDDEDDEEEQNGFDSNLMKNDTSIVFDGENDDDFDDGLAISANTGEVENSVDSDGDFSD